MLKQLPVGRNFTETLYLVPGVSDSSRRRHGEPLDRRRQRPREQLRRRRREHHQRRASAASASYSIVFGSLGTGVTTDFIKETQVKTAGFEAEYGQATGGVVNVVTKSGTNAVPRQPSSATSQPAGLEGS